MNRHEVSVSGSVNDITALPFLSAMMFGKKNAVSFMFSRIVSLAVPVSSLLSLAAFISIFAPSATAISSTATILPPSTTAAVANVACFIITCPKRVNLLPP